METALFVVVCLILGAVVVLGYHVLDYLKRIHHVLIPKEPTNYSVAEPPIERMAEIVKIDPKGEAVHVGYREPEHPDIKQALANKDLAVRWGDGRLEYGRSQ